MSLEKIKPSKRFTAGFDTKLNYIESIKKEILAETGIVVRIKLKPPSTIVLTCGSASESSEISSQRDSILKNINTILDRYKEKNITNIVIKQF